jgi:hypothetical protein
MRYTSGPLRLSPLELGVLVSKAAVQSATEGDQSLHAVLYNYTSETRRARWEYWTEMFVLGLFSWDYSIARKFGPLGDAGRFHARALLWGFVNDNMNWAGFTPFSPSAWEEYLAARFQVYADALKPQAEGGQALLRLGGRIHECLIGGPKDIGAISKITIWLTTDLIGTREALERLDL